MRPLARILALAAFVLPVGCGGGSSVPPATVSELVSGRLTLKVSQAVAASTIRHAQFVSPSAVSVSVAIDGGTPTVASIGPTSPDCTTTGGNRTCNIPLEAPTGADTFAISQYDGPNATGKLLGSGIATTTVVAGQPFTVAATLSGAVGSIALALGPVPPAGTPGTTTLTVEASDPDGNVIVGAGNYSVPIALAVTDPTGQTTLSTYSVAGPAQSLVTVRYAGGLGVSATITASGTGVTSARAVFTPAGATYYYTTDATTNTLTAYPLAANGNVAPSRTVSGAATGLAFPRRIVADAANDLYVANASATPESITVYAPQPNGNVAPIRTIQGANTILTGPDGIALDATNTLYVTDCGTCYLGSPPTAILVFAAGANGNVAPIREITGANTNLDDITDVSVDGTSLLVSNYGSSAITIYPITANGNVAPTATLAGANTDIANPECVTTDKTGAIYVCNATANTITVYPAGSVGNAAPTRTLGGANTLLSDPVSAIFDAAGNMYVANADDDTITVYGPGANGNQAPLYTLTGANTGLNAPIGLTLSP